MFRQETGRILHELGYVIYPLSARTLSQIKGERYHVSVDLQGVEGIKRGFFENDVSLFGEVAVKPHNYITQANRKLFAGNELLNLASQERQLERVRRELTRRISGITAVFGTVADYAELGKTHFEATGQTLFMMNDAPVYFRTASNVQKDTAIVGGFKVASGNAGYVLDVQRRVTQADRFQVVLAPLLLPI
jgi:hypothetical protein